MKKLLLACAASVLLGAAPVPKAPFPAFLDRFLEEDFKVEPTYAVYQGRHDHDGELPDWSDAGLKSKAAFYRAAIAQAQGFTDNRLTRDQRFERDYLIAVARGRLFWLEDADQPHRNPSYYISMLDPNVYVARPYADAATRMRAVTAFARHIPAAAAQVRANLRMPMPLTFINFGKAGFQGLADYYAKDVPAAFAGVKDAKLQADLAAATTAAATALHGLAEWLEQNRGAATQDFALGPERFQRMLYATEMVDTPVAELEAVGRADLKRNQDALNEACAAYAPGASITDCTAKANAHKGEGGPVATARRQIPELRAFVLAKQLVTIPGTEQALANEAPPFMRQNTAYIDPPGPYEHGLPSVYYISPPDPAWTPEVQRASTPGETNLLFVTVHEVMPGHFLQFLHANRSPSFFSRVFVGNAFAEGWAHYAEEMMWEAGLRKGDPEAHIGQLANALQRDCRYLSAIGLHTQGMTVEQSRKMFVEQCYQAEGTARQQAARGTYDPAYLVYTMGKLMIRRLRTDWTATHGGRAGWKAFHDELLDHGGPPIPLVRGLMMDTKSTAAF
ncbi:DUF885 domain-containing protein [Sphingomonas nostoxanthinifaciens]|uniref:DUF885 domain-containing protein n=1 Tax=Sphingomonas nostoxanthinifaciens TaxID=2872652 RepID=UPI001CC1F8DF|nr:DUF885 domain-containing protein [Sphingomonas nostoxanthinifaciens]UAK25329.1 DUF885 domain-containing protein [Sphingomonas nostoxanthinifaciens]